MVSLYRGIKDERERERERGREAGVGDALFSLSVPVCSMCVCMCVWEGRGGGWNSALYETKEHYWIFKNCVAMRNKICELKQLLRVDTFFICGARAQRSWTEGGSREFFSMWLWGLFYSIDECEREYSILLNSNKIMKKEKRYRLRRFIFTRLREGYIYN